MTAKKGARIKTWKTMLGLCIQVKLYDLIKYSKQLCAFIQNVCIILLSCLTICIQVMLLIEWEQLGDYLQLALVLVFADGNHLDQTCTIGFSVLGIALLASTAIGIFCGVKYILLKKRCDEATRNNTNNAKGAADTTQNEHASGYSHIDLSDINTTPSSYDAVDVNTTEYAEIH